MRWCVYVFVVILLFQHGVAGWFWRSYDSLDDDSATLHEETASLWGTSDESLTHADSPTDDEDEYDEDDRTMVAGKPSFEDMHRRISKTFPSQLDDDNKIEAAQDEDAASMAKKQEPSSSRSWWWPFGSPSKEPEEKEPLISDTVSIPSTAPPPYDDTLGSGPEESKESPLIDLEPPSTSTPSTPSGNTPSGNTPSGSKTAVRIRMGQPLFDDLQPFLNSLIVQNMNNFELQDIDLECPIPLVGDIVFRAFSMRVKDAHINTDSKLNIANDKLRLSFKDIRFDLEGQYSVSWGSQRTNGSVMIKNEADIEGDLLIKNNGKGGVKTGLTNLSTPFKQFDVRISNTLLHWMTAISNKIFGGIVKRVLGLVLSTFSRQLVIPTVNMILANQISMGVSSNVAGSGLSISSSLVGDPTVTPSEGVHFDIAMHVGTLDTGFKARKAKRSLAHDISPAGQTEVIPTAFLHDELKDLPGAKLHIRTQGLLKFRN